MNPIGFTDACGTSGPLALVVMGVSGCGKSSVGAALAAQLGWVWVEGDDFHSEANRRKMSKGMGLTDEDRADWLVALGEEIGHRLTQSATGVVLGCSALKRSYRDRLRAAVPGLRFVFLDITPEEATRRVAQRAGHFFQAGLVASQFTALEDPRSEAGVLTVPADLDGPSQRALIQTWLGEAVAPGHNDSDSDNDSDRVTP